MTRDDPWSTGAAFTVVARGYAHVYLLVQEAWPGSFTAAVAPEAARTFVETLVLSFATLGSTGRSHIVPIEPHGRSFVMIEQVAGMLHLALVVGRVVGLTIARQRDH